MKQYEFMRDTDENGNQTISVSDKPKRRLDLIPRLVCLIFALGIWLWMVNFNDTDITETIVLKIQLDGQDVLESKDMMYYGLDKYEIAVTVKGSNRDLKKYEAKDYKATVDLSKIYETGPNTLPLVVTTPAGSSLTIDSEPLNVNLMVDFIAEKEVTFDTIVTNIQDSGQIKYSYETELGEGLDNKIMLVGPATFIDQISSARLSADGSFATNYDEIIFSDFPLTFLDKNFNPITLDESVIEYSTADIEVKVIAIAHKEVPVKVVVTGEGSDLIATPSIKAIEIWGTPSLVKQVGEYVFMLDKAEMGKDGTHITSSDLLGDGVFVTDGVQITVSFTEPVS